MKFLTVEQIEEIAERIRRLYNIQDDYFIDITQFAKKENYKIYEAAFTDNRIEGALEVDEHNKIIRVNESYAEPWKRFIIAHEFAHGILHDDGVKHIDYLQPLDYYLKPDDLKKELQANILGTALIMPAELVKEAWYKTKSIDAVAAAFSVSEKAASIRLEVLGLLDARK